MTVSTWLDCNAAVGILTVQDRSGSVPAKLGREL